MMPRPPQAGAACADLQFFGRRATLMVAYHLWQWHSIALDLNRALSRPHTNPCETKDMATERKAR